MIEGVKIIKLTSNKDDRGYFREIFRNEDGLLDNFGQISVSLTKPGIIKAFHWHKQQDDLFYVVSGKAVVVLYDRRKNSKTFGRMMKIRMHEDLPRLLLIPKGIAHGYIAIGKKPLMMLYVMSKSYNPRKPDEFRISHDDSRIGFDWKKYG
ncbi:dTDP-4-dehydrorhamnose 3,5-epimerase family protein [Candidatus Woesearchaeota archaeon]|nr:dTDP-4-dehydrorhamnose 3,5-epimerase family protein [Candidatus Woesearchaeota archaeon]